MKKRYCLILAFIILGSSCLALVCASAVNQQKGLSKKIIRLHVVANSDDARDQEFKIMVRDEILKYFSQWQWETLDEASRCVSAHLDNICTLSQKVLEDAGAEQTVSADFSLEEYPTRHYDTFSLPAGKYLSLRVILGEGDGKNWWCVVYPSICLPAESDMRSVAASAGFAEREIQLITDKNAGIKLKFKILEIFRKLKSFL